MGKSALIAETGAGQHGVATAAAAARLGLRCTIYMGAEDVERQSANVRRMKLLGAEVRPVESGSRTLKDAINAALRAWISEQADTHYCFGTAAGPYPFPDLVREFQSVIGREARAQMLERTGSLPDYVVAAVGGGSNAIGMFAGFLDDEEVTLIGAEPGGRSLDPGQHAASMTLGVPTVCHGFKGYFLPDENGDIAPVYSISAGVDYPGVGPEHCQLKDTGRAQYVPVFDDEAVEAFMTLSRTEGIIPAPESCHAIAVAIAEANKCKETGEEKVILFNLTGHGLMDMAAYDKYLSGDLNNFTISDEDIEKNTTGLE